MNSNLSAISFLRASLIVREGVQKTSPGKQPDFDSFLLLKAPMQESPKATWSCSNCFKSPEDVGAQRKFHKCAGCLTVRYCSITCQKEDWLKHHKKECGNSNPMHAKFVERVLGIFGHESAEMKAPITLAPGTIPFLGFHTSMLNAPDPLLRLHIRVLLNHPDHKSGSQSKLFFWPRIERDVNKDSTDMMVFLYDDEHRCITRTGCRLLCTEHMNIPWLSPGHKCYMHNH